MVSVLWEGRAHRVGPRHCSSRSWQDAPKTLSSVVCIFLYGIRDPLVFHGAWPGREMLVHLLGTPLVPWIPELHWEGCGSDG